MATEKRLSKKAAQKLAIEREDREIEEFILSGKALTPNLTPHPFLADKIRYFIQKHYETIYVKFDIGNSELFYPLSYTHPTLFDDDGAVAYTNFHLFRTLGGGQCSEYLKEGVRLLEKHVRHIKIKTGFSFINGEAGIIALGAVLYHYAGKPRESERLMKKLVAEIDEVVFSQEICNTLMEGRAGFLYCLLFVRKHIGASARAVIRDEEVLKVFNKIVDSGRKLALAENRGKILLYRYSNRIFFGAKIGMAGILHTLLLVVHEVISARNVMAEYLPGTLDFMLTFRLPSGNMPVDDVCKDDIFSSWCQGASGMVHLLAHATLFLNQPRFLEAAKEAEEVVWQRGYRGILKDRHGLCHGMAGNGYCHLALFKVTNEPKYFERACLIGVKCFRHNKNIFQASLKPFSLFDGLSGSICYLSDLLDPKSGVFPCFEV